MPKGNKRQRRFHRKDDGRREKEWLVVVVCKWAEDWVGSWNGKGGPGGGQTDEAARLTAQRSGSVTPDTRTPDTRQSRPQRVGLRGGPLVEGSSRLDSLGSWPIRQVRPCDMVVAAASGQDCQAGLLLRRHLPYRTGGQGLAALGGCLMLGTWVLGYARQVGLRGTGVFRSCFQPTRSGHGVTRDPCQPSSSP